MEPNAVTMRLVVVLGLVNEGISGLRTNVMEIGMQMSVRTLSLKWRRGAEIKERRERKTMGRRGGSGVCVSSEDWDLGAGRQSRE